MQYTENQSDISDADHSNCNDFLHRIDTVPKCEVYRNISQVQQIVASEKNPVDGKTHLLVMKKILQIRLSGLKASPSHIDGNVRANGKKNDV